MSFTFKNRSFLTLLDFTPKELKYLLDLSKELKIAKHTGTEKQTLSGKNLALMTEKTITLSRCAFEVAAFDQGAHIAVLDPGEGHVHLKGSLKDTARMLGRLYHGIGYCGFNQDIMEGLAKFAGIPVWNGITNESQPIQALADLLTMQEHCDKSLKKISLCYLGNAHNNIANSLMVASAKMGIDFRVAAPAQFRPDPALVDLCLSIAKNTHAKITLTDTIDEAVRAVDFIYTGAWTTSAEPAPIWNERLRVLKPFQVSMDVMEQARNHKVRFMHCLPAFHNRETVMGEDFYSKYGMEAMEVTDEVFESSASIVWDQAENRLHTIKAVMMTTLGS